MTILRDFFGAPLKVGDRVAFMPSATGGWSHVKLGTIKAIRTEPYHRRERVYATIEREVSGRGYSDPLTHKWVSPTKLADHEFLMDGRPVFKAPDEVAEDAYAADQMNLALTQWKL
jgi:hypothetical protein